MSKIEVPTKPEDKLKHEILLLKKQVKDLGKRVTDLENK